MKDQRRQCVLEGDNEIRAQALWPALLDGDDCEALFRSRDGLLLVEADDWDENRRLRARQMDVATIRAYIGERVGCKRVTPGRSGIMCKWDQPDAAGAGSGPGEARRESVTVHSP